MVSRSDIDSDLVAYFRWEMKEKALGICRVVG